MGAGSLPDSPAPPAATGQQQETAEERERRWMEMDRQNAQQKSQQPTPPAPQPYQPAVSGYQTTPAPAAAVNTPGLYPQPIAGLAIRGECLAAWQTAVDAF